MLLSRLEDLKEKKVLNPLIMKKDWFFEMI